MSPHCCVMNETTCSLMASFLLVVDFIEVWEGTVDGNVRSRPEESCCLQFLMHGREPDLTSGFTVS